MEQVAYNGDFVFYIAISAVTGFCPAPFSEQRSLCIQSFFLKPTIKSLGLSNVLHLTSHKFIQAHENIQVETNDLNSLIVVVTRLQLFVRKISIEKMAHFLYPMDSRSNLLLHNQYKVSH